MATFTEISQKEYLNNDGRWYKINGELTPEDLIKINSFTEKVYLQVDNTKLLNSNLLRQISNENVLFSVIGGHKFYDKVKYQRKKYVDRTLLTPEGLKEVLSYIEGVEKYLNPKWTDTQKAMFIYECIVKDFVYEENYEDRIDYSMEQTLNGVLYKKLICVGFALLYKEFLDRQNITNSFQNLHGIHSWNIAKLDGEYRGLDVTWDCSNKTKDNYCSFVNFGQQPNFYTGSHNIQSDPEETVFDLKLFTEEELEMNYRIIENSLKQRDVQSQPLYQNQVDLLKMLPLKNERKKELVGIAQVEEEFNLAFDKHVLLNKIYQFLKNNNKMSISYQSGLETYLSMSKNLVDDFRTEAVPQLFFTEKDIEFEEIGNAQFYIHGDYYTDYGSKHQFNNYEQTKNPEKLQELFQFLNLFLEKEYLKNIIEMYENYETLCNNYAQSDINEVSLINRTRISDNLQKMQILLHSEDTLLNLGVTPEEIVRMKQTIENSLQAKRPSEKELATYKKKSDIDFLYALLEDINYLKNAAEIHYGVEYSDEQWLDNFASARFILDTFAAELSEYDVTEEELQEILDNILLDRRKR